MHTSLTPVMCHFLCDSMCDHFLVMCMSTLTSPLSCAFPKECVCVCVTCVLLTHTPHTPGSQAERVDSETDGGHSSQRGSSHTDERTWTAAHRCPKLHVCLLCCE